MKDKELAVLVSANYVIAFDNYDVLGTSNVLVWTGIKH